jgi:hypothetical protein
MKKQTGDGWTLFAGHGQQGGIELIDNMTNYLHTFLTVTASASTQQDAIDSMIAKFPGFHQADFLLIHSVAFHVQ